MSDSNDEWARRAVAVNERLRKALEDIAGRREDDTEHSRTHDPETCEVAICVAKRALKKAGRHG